LLHLFVLDLVWITEKICNHIKEVEGVLPLKYEFLLQIQKGISPEIDFSEFDATFLHCAYRVANNAGNLEMVKKLYSYAGIEEKEKKLKESSPHTYSSDLNYIHEPYWSYNLLELQQYGERIIKKIEPLFIDEKSVGEDEEGKFVVVKDEKIYVRTALFGYVLPNLYLKKRLEDQKLEHLAVPRLFIIPKNKNIEFKFKMPYANTPGKSKNLKIGDAGNNSLQVSSESFTLVSRVHKRKRAQWA
jgi:hypothetical protein